MDPSSIFQTIVLVILLLLSAFFSSAETALTTVNKHKLRSLCDDGNKRAMRVSKLVENPSKLLSTILIGNNVVNISASALATTLVSRVFGNAYVGIATGVLTLLILVFGEITPKSVAAIYNTKIALWYVDIIKFLTIIFTPAIWILDKLSALIFWIIHIDPSKADDSMTESELRTIVNVSHEDGVIEGDEKQMINNVVDFGDSHAKDIMVPRVDSVFVNINSSYEEILDLFMNEQYSRIPVYEESKDSVIGILYIKDLFFYKATHKNEFNLKDIIREPYFTYEYQKTRDLMENMRKNRVSMAIVLDEYGITAGLVTLEDLIEEIVGEIKDEYDEDEADAVICIDDDTYVVDASISIDDLNDILGTSIESEDYDSVGGKVLELLDHLPDEGETANDGHVFYKVLKSDKTRIEKIEVRINPHKDTEDEDEFLIKTPVNDENDD